jgi:trans-aconitate methyltransferase
VIFKRARKNRGSRQARSLTWVDVGCGKGAFTELLVAKSAPSSVCAIDPSDGQIATARRKLSAKQVEFSIGDAMALPYDVNRFDVAVMALVLFFVPDAHKGASEWSAWSHPTPGISCGVARPRSPYGRRWTLSANLHSAHRVRMYRDTRHSRRFGRSSASAMSKLANWSSSERLRIR